MAALTALSADEQQERRQRFQTSMLQYLGLVGRNFPNVYWAPSEGEWKTIPPDQISDPRNLPELPDTWDNNANIYDRIMKQWAEMTTSHDQAVWDPRKRRWVLHPVGGPEPDWLKRMRAELHDLELAKGDMSPGEYQRRREAIFDRYLGGTPAA